MPGEHTTLIESEIFPGLIRGGIPTPSQLKNKNPADIQHTLPWDIFNAKKIILKLDLFMQSLKKMGKEMPKIESEKTIYNVNQGP